MRCFFDLRFLRIIVVFTVSNLTVIPTQIYAETFVGSVTRVSDGDTVMLRIDDSTELKIRLSGIDAPELDQAFGKESKNRLTELVDGRTMKAQCSKRDRYRRWLCKLVLNSDDINLSLVKDGFAWWYRYYRKDQTLEDQQSYRIAEAIAKANELGLWEDSSPIPPWDFRRQKRDKLKRQM